MPTWALYRRMVDDLDAVADEIAAMRRDLDELDAAADRRSDA